MTHEVRILVVEDEQSLREDLQDYLTAKNFLVDAAATVAETQQLLDSSRYDAVILDIGLPDGDGLQLLPQIRSQHPHCGTLILTAQGTPESRIRGLQEGGDAYLVKRATLREIEATLQSVLRRLPQLVSETVPANSWLLDKVNWNLSAPNGLSVTLTSTEITFLQALSENGTAACSREQLGRLLGKRGTSEEYRNLDAVVRRLRRKITLATGSDVPIKVVYGVGYAFSAPLHCIG
ncbi:MAG: response regulator transcription factor [Magnetococcales bacterium]|nr:response regulator transcription factor [Magnetococcales bacterium]